MANRNEKIFVLGMVGLVLFAFFYIQNDESVFTFVVDKFTKVNWDEIKERNIVKNSIPITLISDQGSQCLVNAENFDLIVDHEYFVRSDVLIRELNYDRENNVLTIACDMLQGEKSRLNVWYALEETKRYSNNYEYFVTAWEETVYS